MKDITLDNFIYERIQENKKLFTKKEWECVINNKECMKKMYLIGFTNAKECYQKGKK